MLLFCAINIINDNISEYFKQTTLYMVLLYVNVMGFVKVTEEGHLTLKCKNPSENFISDGLIGETIIEIRLFRQSLSIVRRNSRSSL